MSAAMTDPRLTSMEERIAHLEKQSDELSDIVATQSDEIGRLRRQVLMLMQRAAEQEADLSNVVPLADQKPPHW